MSTPTPAQGTTHVPDGTDLLVQEIREEVAHLVKHPIEELKRLERMPEAAPRWLAGTLPMIEEELGAANIPLPIPFSAMSSAKAG